MGTFENFVDPDTGMSASLPSGLFIVASTAEIDPLRGSWVQDLPASAFVALPPEADVPADVIAEAKILVLEVDPTDRGSLRRLSQVRARRDGLPIIAALKDANVSLVRTLVRQGVTDVAVLPFEPSELATQILDASVKASTILPDPSLAPLTAVVRSTGGCGTTTVITHLAAALARETGRKVCVLDLDVQCGDVVAYLGQTARLTLTDLLEAGDRIDAELLRTAVTDSGLGFSVLAAPEQITPLETVDVDHLMRLVHLARQEFDHVLVDLPADWTNWALSIATTASEVLLVTDLSIGSLRQAKRRLDFFHSVDIGRERVRVVVNRVERRLFKTIGVGEVREALRAEVIATLSDEGAALSAAQDQGLLVTAVSRKSRFGADITGLAKAVVEA